MPACKIAELHAFRLGWFSAQHAMPEVEIDPDDEFHAGRKPETSG
jgi:hypothetical protein